MKSNPKTIDFMRNRVSLHCPSESDIFSAYSHLTAVGTVEISCPLANASTLLRALESAGFFAVYIMPKRGFTRGVRIRAYKSKGMACYDTGKSARYLGSAFAALDDDHHLLSDWIRICDKTANIYRLPAYEKVVTIAGGDPELIDRLETNPVAFDCSTFESDTIRLFNSLSDTSMSEVADTAILYPGPFKILITDDGTMIRRGKALRVVKNVAKALTKSDKCILLKAAQADGAEQPTNFKDCFREWGPLCLVEGLELSSQFETTGHADLTALRETPSEMKQRLIKMIDSDIEYFIMTGSDTRDLDGCCPSDGVRIANQLVEAGILQVARTGSAVESCPGNIYAFSGEIITGNGQPEFAPNFEFRRKISDCLARSERPGWRYLLALLRVCLLLFVVISLAVFAANISQENTGIAISSSALLSGLDLPFQDGFVVLQFHPARRCKFCNEMEILAKQALNTHFSAELRTNDIAFRQINMELPQYRDIRRTFDLFTSTLVFIEVNKGKNLRWQIFTDAWHLTDRREQFVEKFCSELLSFRERSE
jgi:hypothetical protein